MNSNAMHSQWDHLYVKWETYVNSITCTCMDTNSCMHKQIEVCINQLSDWVENLSFGDLPQAICRIIGLFLFSSENMIFGFSGFFKYMIGMLIFDVYATLTSKWKCLKERLLESEVTYVILQLHFELLHRFLLLDFQETGWQGQGGERERSR